MEKAKRDQSLEIIKALKEALIIIKEELSRVHELAGKELSLKQKLAASFKSEGSQAMMYVEELVEEKISEIVNKYENEIDRLKKDILHL